MIADRTARPFKGDLAEYADWLKHRSRALNFRPSEENTLSETKAKSRIKRKKARQASAHQRKQTADIRREFKTLEFAIEDLSVQRRGIVDKLADPSTYQTSTAELKQLILKKEMLDRDIKQAETKWIKIAELLESAD